ncbi:MAG: Tol-Pal system beta propeller repeat protein TolB [Candidatus Sumerlaeaceae bacterium]
MSWQQRLKAVVTGALVVTQLILVLQVCGQIPSTKKKSAPTPISQARQDLGAIRPSNLTLPLFAVSEFAGAEGVGEVVTRDLALADVASAAEHSAALEEARQKDRQSGSVVLEGWTAAGIHYVLRGELKGATAAAELYDVASSQRLLGKIYSGLRAGDERRVAHQIADDIITALTKRPGIFSSYICALVDTGGGNKEVVVMDADGGNMRQLTNEGALLSTPAWGKNGAEIYFTSYRDNNPDLVGITLRGQRFEISRRPGLNTSPSWSEALQRLAVTLSKDGNSEIYTMTRDGRDPVRLTENSDADTAPDWSPDGTQIVFTSDRTGTPQIYVMGADGSSPTRISTGKYCDSPVWSPDGSKIAYVVREGGEFNIYVHELASGELTRVTGGQGANRDPSWAPDSRHIVFESDRGGRRGLYIMDIAVRVAHPLALGAYSAPAWGPPFAR